MIPMPNPLQRRRMDSAAVPATAVDEIAEIKKKLKDLQDAYAQDMANVSLDMRQLSLDLKEAKLNNGAKANPTP